jgi:hypothetical protein
LRFAGDDDRATVGLNRLPESGVMESVFESASERLIKAVKLLRAHGGCLGVRRL